MSEEKLICEDCGYDATDEAEGDWTGDGWQQLPARCPECEGFLEWRRVERC